MAAPTLVVGAPCWNDLYSSDTDKATAFYTELFGWNAEPPEEGFGGYFIFTKDGKAVAGCMANSGEEGHPDAWTVYLMTDDAKAVAEAAAAKGGQVHLEPMEVAENGTMAMVGDPGGAAIGVWQPGAQKGLEVKEEVGAPTWFELLTRDFDASVAFYRDVFKWDPHTMSDTDELRYTTFGGPDAMLAGIMDGSQFLPEGAPAAWSSYFQGEDTDAALAKVEELGGTIVRPAEDTPYGRMATAADPTGTRFKLIMQP
jgi:predicted enzyme related to lactoylglutathione lyase